MMTRVGCMMSHVGCMMSHACWLHTCCVQVITVGALVMELAAAVVLGATVVTYDYFSSRDAD